jgi:tight adherence protein B
MGIGLDPDTSIALVCAVSVALMFGLIAAALGGSAAGRHYQRRLNLVYDRARGNSSPETAAAAQSLSRERSATKLDRIARDWLPRREMLTARLARTGRMISIGRYAMTMVGLAVLAASGLWIGTRLGILSCLSIGLLIGVLVPHLVIGRMGKRRVAAFVTLFPDAIDLIVRALRSGLPVSEAIVGAGHEIADPVGAELRMVESGMRMGRDLEPLLWDVAKRIDAPEFRFFVIALSVQRETGGNLGETLANLGDILRRRKQMQAKARAMASETRATTMILGGLPVLVVGVLSLTSPAYLTPLLNDVRGLILDGIAVGMLASGVLIMNKMAHFEI